MEYELGPSLLTVQSSNKTFNCSKLGYTKWLNDSHSALYGIEISYYTGSSLTSILSIFGCVLIIYYYYTIKELQNKSRQLLVFLTICDFGIAVGNIVGVIVIISTGGFLKNLAPLNGISKNIQMPSCFIQSLVTTAFSIASFLWTSVIGLNVYMTVNRNYRLLVDNYQLWIHIVCWGLPLIVVSVTAGMNRFGYNPCGDESIWICWVAPHIEDTNTTIMLWQLFSGKLWELISYCLVLFLFIAVYCHVKNYIKRTIIRSGSEETPLVTSQSTNYTLANKKLTMIPLVFIVTRIWGTLRFLLSFSHDPDVQDAAAVLAPLQGIFESAQGFLNCLVFMYTTPCLQGRFPMKYLMKKKNQVTCSHHHGTRHSERGQTTTIARGSSSTSSDSDDDVSNIQVIKQ